VRLGQEINRVGKTRGEVSERDWAEALRVEEARKLSAFLEVPDVHIEPVPRIPERLREIIFNPENRMRLIYLPSVSLPEVRFLQDKQGAIEQWKSSHRNWLVPEFLFRDEPIPAPAGLDWHHGAVPWQKSKLQSGWYWIEDFDKPKKGKPYPVTPFI
jgi:hypothetical protein